MLPINTGGPLERIAPKPKPQETKPTRKPTRRVAGTISGLDVVVSNAGYANVASIEIGDDADFRAHFETGRWGVYHVSEAVIPILREQSGGLIIQFSSMGGRVRGSPEIASIRKGF